MTTLTAEREIGYIDYVLNNNETTAMAVQNGDLKTPIVWYRGIEPHPKHKENYRKQLKTIAEKMAEDEKKLESKVAKYLKQTNYITKLKNAQVDIVIQSINETEKIKPKKLKPNPTTLESYAVEKIFKWIDENKRILITAHDVYAIARLNPLIQNNIQDKTIDTRKKIKKAINCELETWNDFRSKTTTSKNPKLLGQSLIIIKDEKPILGEFEKILILDLESSNSKVNSMKERILPFRRDKETEIINLYNIGMLDSYILYYFHGIIDNYISEKIDQNRITKKIHQPSWENFLNYMLYAEEMRESPE